MIVSKVVVITDLQIDLSKYFQTLANNENLSVLLKLGLSCDKSYKFNNRTCFKTCM